MHFAGLPYILPEESVIKAIDVWEVMCISLVFAGMLEFALMHTMLMRRKKIKMAVEMEEKAKKDVQETDRDAMVCSRSIFLEGLSAFSIMWSLLRGNLGNLQTIKTESNLLFYSE